MANFAVLNQENQIINVIVADSLKIAIAATERNCVELPERGFGIGDSYDGTQFIRFVDPVVRTEELTND
jgi:hypothetical protein